MAEISSPIPRTGKDLSRCQCFISYRRSDTGQLAHKLAQRLTDILGNGVVFFDSDSIGKATDFGREIETALAHVRLVLVLIGKEWASVKKNGQKRLWLEDDPVRVEIDIALKTGHHITVLPVLVDETVMPDETHIPPPLKPLRFINAMDLRTCDEHFEHDLLKLVEFIQSVLRPIRSFRYQTIYAEPLIGRGDEVQQLTEWLTVKQWRQIALIGAPGLGKTHLACAVGDAEAVIKRFAHRVFVDLTGQETIDSMCQEVAQQLDVRTDNKANTRLLIRDNLAAQPESLLMVLDNLEQLADKAGPMVQEWARASEKVSILITSRVHLGGEWHELMVQPLTRPKQDDTLEQLAANDAVRLFERRATFRQPAFRLQDDACLMHTASICRRLDCNPLAILLMAELIVYRSVHVLDQEFAFSLEAANGDSTQGKLFSVIERSLSLLSKEARGIFVQIHIFEDGFSDHAATAVLGVGSGLTQKERFRQVVHALRELERHSLVHSTESFCAGKIRLRYQMFRVIGELARRKQEELRGAAARRATAALAARRLKYFHAYASEWDSLIHSPSSQEALEMLTLERENIVTAAEAALSKRDTRGVDVYLAYAEHLTVRGPADIRGRLLKACMAKEIKTTEVQRLAVLGHFVHHCWAIDQYPDAEASILEISQTRPELKCQAAYPKALMSVGWLRYHRDGNQVTKRVFQECLEVFEQIHDQRGVAQAWRAIASVLDSEGQYAEAIMMIGGSIRYFESKGDAIELAHTYTTRGLIQWHAGSFDQALLDFSEAERQYEAMRNVMRMAGTLTNQGLALTDAERFDEALVILDRAAPLHRKGGNPAWFAVNEASRGRALQYRGSNTEALGVLREALALSRRGAYKENIALCTLTMARALAATGKNEEAMRMFAETRELQKELYGDGNRRACRTLISMAHLYAAMSDPQNALACAEEALKMIERMGIRADDPRPAMRRDYQDLMKLLTTLENQ